MEVKLALGHYLICGLTMKKKAQSDALGFNKTLLRLIGACGYSAIAFALYIHPTNSPVELG